MAGRDQRRIAKEGSWMAKKVIISILTAVAIVGTTMALFGLFWNGIFTTVFQIAFYLEVDRKAVWLIVILFTLILAGLIFSAIADEKRK